MSQRSAERDSLLLSTRELAGLRVRAVEKAHALEQLARTRRRVGSWHGGERQWERDELLRGQLAFERAPVVLVRIAEDVAAIAAELARRGTEDVESGDDERAGGRSRQTREHSHERRLSRPARPEHDADLVVLHGQREALQRGDAARRRRVDGEEVAGIDERRHHSASR